MSTYHPYTIFPLGDSAMTIEFSDTIDESSNNKVLQLFHQISNAKVPYVTGLVPAYSSLTIHYDVTALHQISQSAFGFMANMVEKFTGNELKSVEQIGKLVEIPVCYEDQFALDMDEVSEKKNLSADEIVNIHTSKIYRVYMLGFVPGFSYMGEVDERLIMPRKPEPRLRVEPGSVGITGKQTGVYPLVTPGGWQIIGRTPMQLFHKDEENPVTLQPGDTVRFYSISANEFKNYQKRHI